MPALFWWLLGGLVVGTGVVVAVSSPSEPAPEGFPVPKKDYTHVLELFPHYPTVPPYYPANIRTTRRPICWVSTPGEWHPTRGATAIDVSGEPYISFEITKAKPSGLNVGGATMTVRQLSDEALDQVFDVDARTWSVSVENNPDVFIGTYQWFSASWDSGEKSFFEKLEAIAVNYVLPAIIVIAGAVVTAYTGPIGGALTAAALTAVYKIAKGAPVTDAIVQAYQEKLASTVEKTAYFEAYKQASSTYNQTKEEINKLRDQFADKLGGGDPQTIEEVRKAVEVGITVARAKQLQDAAVAAVRSRIDVTHADGTNYANWLDKAMSHGVLLTDWVGAMYGNEARAIIEWAAYTANNALDAGQDPIAAVRPKMVLLNPSLFVKGAPEGLAPRSFRSFAR